MQLYSNKKTYNQLTCYGTYNANTLANTLSVRLLISTYVSLVFIACKMSALKILMMYTTCNLIVRTICLCDRDTLLLTKVHIFE